MIQEVICDINQLAVIELALKDSEYKGEVINLTVEEFRWMFDNLSLSERKDIYDKGWNDGHDVGFDDGEDSTLQRVIK